MSQNHSDMLTVVGEMGVIETQVEYPATVARGVAIICHPHPLYGGSMDNKVAWSLARAALANGCIAIRFNFRGVGKSVGAYADGVGETEDALAVLRAARMRWAELPLTMLGFSFGAAVALRVSVRETLSRLVTVAPPLFYFAPSTLPQPICPWLVVHGDADEVVNWPETQSRLAEITNPVAPTVVVMPGVGHFFHGALNGLRDAVGQWLDAQS